MEILAISKISLAPINTVSPTLAKIQNFGEPPKIVIMSKPLMSSMIWQSISDDSLVAKKRLLNYSKKHNLTPTKMEMRSLSLMCK